MLAEGRREDTTDELSNIMPLLTAFISISGILTYININIYKLICTFAFINN